MSARRLRPEPMGRLVAWKPVAGAEVGAAYELGLWCEKENDLERAARWYRRAAEAGYPQAALRLGDVLGRLADRQDVNAEQPPELLLAEATRWLSAAASTPGAMELITDMLNRQQRLAARRAREPEVAGSPG